MEKINTDYKRRTWKGLVQNLHVLLHAVLTQHGIVWPWHTLFVCMLFQPITSHVVKNKIVAIQWIKSRIWDAIDDWYINNLTKNQVSAVFHSVVICRSVSPKFIGLWDAMFVFFRGTQTWRPKSNRNIWHWVLLLKRKIITLELLDIERNVS